MKSPLMPSISKCEEEDCTYNQQKSCHAIAINVGDPGGCAMCDTFFKGSQKGGNQSVIGSVGACKEGDCTFNTMFVCSAESISIMQHGGHPDCATYQRR